MRQNLLLLGDSTGQVGGSGALFELSDDVKGVEREGNEPLGLEKIELQSS